MSVITAATALIVGDTKARHWSGKGKTVPVLKLSTTPSTSLGKLGIAPRPRKHISYYLDRAPQMVWKWRRKEQSVPQSGIQRSSIKRVTNTEFPLQPNMDQFDPVSFLKNIYLKFLFNIIFPTTPKYSTEFLNQNSTYKFISVHGCCTFLPIQPVWFTCLAGWTEHTTPRNKF